MCRAKTSPQIKSCNWCTLLHLMRDCKNFAYTDANGLILCPIKDDSLYVVVDSLIHQRKEEGWIAVRDKILDGIRAKIRADWLDKKFTEKHLYNLETYPFNQGL